MKNLIMILIAFVTLQISAQDQKREMKKQHMASKTDYSPEQMAQLQAKQLTLNLDLNEKQQQEVSALFLENAKLRQSKKEAFSQSKEKEENKTLSKEERFKMKNERMDQQIETRKKMKSILSQEQYEKWGKINAKRYQNKKRQMHHYKSKK